MLYVVNNIILYFYKYIAKKKPTEIINIYIYIW